MNPHVTLLIEIVKALGIRLGIVFVLVILLWNPEPPGIYPRNTMLAFRFLACFVGTAITYWWKVRAMRGRATRLVIFLCLTVVTYLGYRYAVTPSKPANSPFFVDMAVVTYIVTSFFYGFCGGEIASVFEAQVAKARGSQRVA